MGREHVLEGYIKQFNLLIGVELGVWKGRVFKHLLKTCPDLHLIGVDLYAPQPENTGPEKWTPGENGHEWNHNAYYQDIMNNIFLYGRGEFIRNYTVEASKQFEDESIDFVFIDADHSEEGVRNDIIAWTPKVKKGGFIFGHDINWTSVRNVVEEFFGNSYEVKPDNVWVVKK